MKLKPLLLLFLVLAGSGALLVSHAAPLPYRTQQVGAQVGELRQSVEGSVEAERHAQLALPVQGAVVLLPLRAGDRVKAGQLLMRVDARAASQSAAAAAAQQEALRAQARLAEQELGRQRQLKSQGFISQAALEQAETQFRATEAQLRAQSAAAGAAATQAGLHELRAPFDGVLAELPVSLGDLAVPGRALATVFDPRQLRVSVNLPLAQLPPAGTPMRVEIAGRLVEPTRVERLPLVRSHRRLLPAARRSRRCWPWWPCCWACSRCWSRRARKSRRSTSPWPTCWCPSRAPAVRDVEQMVATPAEQVLAQIAGVEHVMSSRPGMAVLTVQFKVGVPRTEALVRLHDTMSSQRRLAAPRPGRARAAGQAQGHRRRAHRHLTLFARRTRRRLADLERVAHSSRPRSSACRHARGRRSAARPRR
jgi:pyruvate/2-oxoglutarate dehydrogenase complex dihydrolipoamide acyltransferase (E2) component